MESWRIYLKLFESHATVHTLKLEIDFGVARHTYIPATVRVIAHILRIEGIGEHAVCVVQITATAWARRQGAGDVGHIDFNQVAACLQVQPQIVCLRKKTLAAIHIVAQTLQGLIACPFVDGDIIIIAFIRAEWNFGKVQANRVIDRHRNEEITVCSIREPHASLNAAIDVTTGRFGEYSQFESLSDIIGAELDINPIVIRVIIIGYSLAAIYKLGGKVESLRGYLFTGENHLRAVAVLQQLWVLCENCRRARRRWGIWSGRKRGRVKR